MKVIKKLRYYKFLFSRSIDSFNFLPMSQSNLLLLTVAYNNVEFIRLQISLLKKNFKDDFYHCIVDNSSDPFVRVEIQEICKVLNVSYFGIPYNFYKNNKSHAAAMHWSYFQIINKHKFEYFGFLDHDIFPFCSFSLKHRFNQGIYGRVVNSYFHGGYQEKISDLVPYWSIWAGFCFFKSSFFKSSFPWDFNFFSKHFPGGYFLDTGGGLWNLVYSKLKYPGKLASYYKIFLEENSNSGDQNDGFEIIDDSWIHFVSLSNWRSISDLEKKKQIFETILNSVQEKILK